MMIMIMMIMVMVMMMMMMMVMMLMMMKAHHPTFGGKIGQKHSCVTCLDDDLLFLEESQTQKYL